MPGVQLSKSTKPFLTVVGGTFRQKVEEGTPGAKLREGELKDGSTYSKWELEFTEWTGVIQSIAFTTSEYGDQCLVDFGDAVIALATNRDFFYSFAKKLCSADVKKEITLAPYSFEPNGKPRKGMTVKQSGAKLQDFFYGKPDTGYPVAKPTMSKSDWKMFWLQVEVFLTKKVQELGVVPIEEPTPDVGHIRPAGEPTNVKDEEVKITDLPF